MKQFTVKQLFVDVISPAVLATVIFDVLSIPAANILRVFQDDNTIINTTVYSTMFWVVIVALMLNLLVWYNVQNQRNKFANLIENLEQKVQNNNPEDLHIRTFLSVAKAHVQQFKDKTIKTGAYSLILVVLLNSTALYSGDIAKILNLSIEDLHFSVMFDIRFSVIFVLMMVLGSLWVSFGNLRSNYRFFNNPTKTLMRYPDFRKWDFARANESSKLHFGVELNKLFTLM